MSLINRKGLAVVLTIAMMAGFVFNGGRSILPLAKIAQAGDFSSVTITSSDVNNSPSATVNYTIQFTPATTSTGWSSVWISFASPPDSRFNISNATLDSSSSAVFTGIGNRDTEYGGIGINASSLPSQQLTIILKSIVNPSKAGKFGVMMESNGAYSNGGFGQLDKGNTSVTVGTMGIDGTVKLPNGTVAKGVWVEAQDKTNPSQRSGSSPDFVSGEYGLGGLTNGHSYMVNVFLNPDPNGNTQGYVPPESVTVNYAGSKITHNFVLVAATKTATGVLRRSNGAAIANGRMMAMRMDGPGFVNTQTNSSGVFTMLMSGGKWEIRPDTFSGPNQTPPDYAFSGPGIQVSFAKDSTVETKTGLDFSVLSASATITGKVSPNPGGWSGLDVHNKTGFGIGTGLNPNDASFSVRVPSGTYELGLFMDQSQGGDTYAFPDMAPVTVGENETKNLGTINLIKMDKTINVTVRDSVSKQGLPGFEVGCFKPRGSGFSHSRTDSNGTAQVKVTEGEWGCMAMTGMGGGPKGDDGPKAWLQQMIGLRQALALEQQDQPKKYVMMGGPQFITVSSSNSPSIIFDALEANRTISVLVTDTNNVALQEYGFIEAELVDSDKGDNFDKGGGLGQPIDPNMPGMAEIKVPAGTYDLRMMTPPGSDYSSGDVTRVDVTSGDASAMIKLLRNDSTISGDLKDEDGNKVTGVFVHIAASNRKGAFIPGNADSATGTYSMRVPAAGGTLNLGYFVDPESGYFPQPFSDNSVTPVAGQTQTKDIVMKKATTTVTVTVKNPDGQAVSNAFVEADSRKSDTKFKIDRFFNFGQPTDANGQVTLRLPAGDFTLETFLPPQTLRDNKWLPPKGEELTLVKNDVKSLTLTFQKADVVISGKVTKSDGTAVSNAFITAFSGEGEAMETSTDNSGNYTINVTPGEWHVKAEKDDTTINANQPTPLISSDTAFDTGTALAVTKNIAVVSGEALSSPVTSTFDSDNSKVVRLTDGALNGANITIPQDALDSDSQGGNVSVTAESTVEIPHQLLDKPLGGIGLGITAQDSSGQPITSTLSSVAITIPLEQQDLTNAGLTVADIGKRATMSYYDEENGKWTPLEGSVAYIEQDATGDGDVTDATDQVLVTGQSSHFTVFAVTAATDSIPAAAPSNVSAAAGDAKVTLGWTNPSDADFAKIKIYRSTTSGTVGDAVTTISSTTTTSYENTGLTNGTKYYYVVRSVDASNNESTNTTQVSATPGTLPKTGSPSAWNRIFGWISNLVQKIVK